MTGPPPLAIPVDIGRDEARRRALEELGKSKYTGLPPWLTDLLDRISDAVLEWLERLATGMLRPAAAGGGVNWTFLITVVAVLALIVFVVWRVGLPRRAGRRAAGSVGADTAVPPQGYRDRAEAAAAAGDWHTAVTDRFRALVRTLEELTVIDPRPARTAWEVGRIAGRAVPAARPALDAAAQLFNDVEYGEQVAGRVADAQTYRAMTAWDAEVTAAASRADLADGGDGDGLGEGEGPTLRTAAQTAGGRR